MISKIYFRHQLFRVFYNNAQIPMINMTLRKVFLPGLLAALHTLEAGKLRVCRPNESDWEDAAKIDHNIKCTYKINLTNFKDIFNSYHFENS